MPEREPTQEEKLLHSQAASWRGQDMTQRLVLFLQSELGFTRKQYGDQKELERFLYFTGKEHALEYVLALIEEGIEKPVEIEFEQVPVLTERKE